MQAIRIIEIPDCKMVSSGDGMFGDEHIDKFDKWLSNMPRTMLSMDFLMDGASGGFCWLYMYEEGMNTAGFEVIDFKGGLYAIATDIDQKTDSKKMGKAIDKFLKDNGFVRDSSRPELGNIITPPEAKKAMGFEQMDYYTPIKAK